MTVAITAGTGSMMLAIGSQAISFLREFLDYVEASMSRGLPHRQLDERCRKLLELADRIAPSPEWDRMHRVTLAVTFVEECRRSRRSRGRVSPPPASMLPPRYRPLVARLDAAARLRSAACFDEVLKVARTAEGSRVAKSRQSMMQLVRKHRASEPRVLAVDDEPPSADLTASSRRRQTPRS